MAFGTLGSTLNDELNRLANGGTYRDMDDMVDEALAAKQWANRENIVPYSTDTVGILNEIAALGPNRQNWFDFNGVCNYLAGTTGLPAAAALRQITTTGDILTSLAAFYTDAATPRYNYPGYIRLDGTTGNSITTPDEAALDITGDLDLRVYAALDNWASGVTMNLLAKWNTTGNQRSYVLYLNSDNKLYLAWSPNGTTVNNIACSVVTGITAGTPKWVRVTLDVDNGASGNTVTFFTSDNGTSWTQLGTTVVTAGVTSVFAGTAVASIGTDGNNASPLIGRVYQAQIFASTNGTDKRLDVDLTTNVTSATYDQFTATTGQLCTIFGQNTLTNAGTAGSLLPVTVGSSLAADSNDAKFLDHTGTNYVYVPGVSSNFLSVPDATALDITGDIDLRVQLALDDWTPSASQRVLVKGASGQQSYELTVSHSPAGFLNFRWSTDGTTLNTAASNTTAVPFADGTAGWIRATRVASTGLIKFFTSTDGSTWTQLGTDVSGTSGNLFSGTGNVVIGQNWDGGNPTAGKVYRAQIFNGIDGTKVLDVDTSVITSGEDRYVVPTTYTGQTGAYFTGSGLSLNGVAGNYVSTPDYAAIDITGDIDIQCKVALTDWTPAAQTGLISKYVTGTNQRSYLLTAETNGTLKFLWSANGTNQGLEATSDVTGIADGATKWVRVTVDVDNGASGRSIRFFLSDDGTNWTQLGSTITQAGTTSIFASTVPLEIGAFNTGTALANGTFYRTIIKSGINGYTVFDADFTQVPANALRMTESSINKAVVTLNTTRYATINRSTSGRKTVAVTQPTWLFGTDDYMEVNNRYMAHSTSDENYVYLSGATGNYMSVADNPPLDITGDLDIQCKVALDDWTPASAQRFVAKRTSSGNQNSYDFYVDTDGKLYLFWSTDGGSVNIRFPGSTVATGITDGTTKWVRATLDVDNGASGYDVKFFLSDDGITWTQLGTTITGAGVTNVYSGTATAIVGAWNNGVSGNAKGKFYRAIIKNGIDGTTVLDANAAVITLPSQTTFTDSSSNAYTVTINKSGVGTFVSTGNYLYLPGVASNNATTPDSAALDITGDIDIRVKVALDDWTPGTQMALLAKDIITGSQRSYNLGINTSGQMAFVWSVDGATPIQKFSNQLTVVDGATLWVRVTLDVNNGAGGNDVSFFTSTNGLTWTQLGTTQTTAGTTSIYSGTAPLEIGSQVSGVLPARGKFFRAQVYNGIGGTLAFDANFEGSITSLNQASFTESSSNAATVTINRSGSTYRSAGVIDAGYLYPGATNTFSNSTTDFLNFGATDSLTALVVVRQWGNLVANGKYLQKRAYVTTSEDLRGYEISGDVTPRYSVTVDYGSTENSVVNPMTYGGLSIVALVGNRATSTISNYVNNVVASGVFAAQSLANFDTLEIGRLVSHQDFEFVGAAVFRQALTATQIRQIVNYFANREAYL